MRQKNTALRGVALLTCVSLFSQALAFLYRVWLARLISAEAIGLYQLVMPAYSIIMSLCVSGFTVAVSRLTASHTALGQEASVRQTVRAARSAYLLMVLGVSAVVIPFSDWISATVLGDARCRMGLLLLLPCIALTGWENVHKNYFYGKKNVVPPSCSEVTEQIVRTAAILGLLFFFTPQHEETQVGFIIVGMIISEVVSAAMLTGFYRRAQPRSEAPGRSVWDAVRRIAAPVAGANVAINLIGSANAVIIPQRLIASGVAPSEALGAFGVAFGMTMPLLALPQAVSGSIALVMVPRLSESAARGRVSEIRKKLRSATLATGAAAALCSAFLIPFGAPIARALFRNPAAGAYMAPLTVATVFVCFESLLGSFLNALGLQRRTASNYIVAGVVQLALTWLGVARPELRLMGFVLAYIASNVLGTALCGFDLWRATRDGMSNYRAPH